MSTWACAPLKNQETDLSWPAPLVYEKKTTLSDPRIGWRETSATTLIFEVFWSKQIYQPLYNSTIPRFHDSQRWKPSKSPAHVKMPRVILVDGHLCQSISLSEPPWHDLCPAASMVYCITVEIVLFVSLRDHVRHQKTHMLKFPKSIRFLYQLKNQQQRINHHLSFSKNTALPLGTVLKVSPLECTKTMTWCPDTSQHWSYQGQTRYEKMIGKLWERWKYPILDP